MAQADFSQVSPSNWVSVNRLVVDPVLIPLLDHLIKPGINALDVGCGSGMYTRELADRGAQVTGIDKNPSLIAQAEREVAGSIKWIAGNIAEWQSYTFFDVILAVFSLNEMPPTELRLAIEKIGKTLKNGGHLLAVIPSPLHDISERTGLINRLGVDWEKEGSSYETQILLRDGTTIITEDYHYSIDEWKRQFSRGGLNVAVHELVAPEKSGRTAYEKTAFYIMFDATKS